MCYNSNMKTFNWYAEKNQWLKKVRGITFNAILHHIEAGDLLDVLEHKNTRKYPGQKIFVVNVEGYVVLVPFIESEDTLFLKTIYPSRKMTKRHLGKDTK